MPDTSFYLRDATLHDLKQIMSLEAYGFEPGHSERRETYAQRIETFPEGSLMAYLGDDCVGCLFSEIWPYVALPTAERFLLGHDIRRFHEPERGTELYVTSMTVEPRFRGQGLGAKILSGGIDRVAERFPRLDSVLLLVNAEWSFARDIYFDDGFEEILTLRHFFPAGAGAYDDGIVMRRAVLRELR